MQPALNPDGDICDYVFLSRWAIRNYTVERGDIVSLISPKDPEQKIIKRVVALPVTMGHFFNKCPLETNVFENWLFLFMYEQGDVVSTIGYKKPYVKIPDGFCWIEGDHTGEWWGCWWTIPFIKSLVFAGAIHKLNENRSYALIRTLWMAPKDFHWKRPLRFDS